MKNRQELKFNKADIHAVLKNIVIKLLEIGSKNNNKRVQVTIQLVNGGEYTYETTRR
jgi:hypothetical protein